MAITYATVFLCLLTVGASGSNIVAKDGAPLPNPTTESATNSPAVDHDKSAASVTELVRLMEKSLTEVALMVEAARTDRKAAVLSCLVKKMAQIGKHLRFAKKVEVEQFDTAIRLKDPGATDIARTLAKRLTMVLELRAQAAACAGDYTGYLSGDTVLEYQSVPSAEWNRTAFVYGTVFTDSRPPAASPYQ
jgi:hypothetical protein